MKRLFALLLCLAMLICSLVSCSNKEGEDEEPGAYIHMYLSEPIYNFDPAAAYQNEAALKVISLLYENLFVLGENGKVEKSLVKSYKIDKEKNIMSLKLRTDTAWTDTTPVSAYDVVDAWKRILSSSNSYEAAVLLYDVKNAKEAKAGTVNSIDDVGVKAHSTTDLDIEFVEGFTDYDGFMLKLTSYALCPVRDNIMQRTENEYDWAKVSVVTSGPFRINRVSYSEENAGLILQRNQYYHRDNANDKKDKTVKPYRIIIDYTKTDEQIMTAYENGEIFFVGDIPLSVRSNYKDVATVTDAMSTHTYIFNTEKEINGEKLFAKKEVRQALSLVIDRTDIANTVVFAKPATGFVPYGVYEADSNKNLFRDNGEAILAETASVDAAKELLKNAGVTASKYSFELKVPAYDEVHVAIAEKVVAAWNSLGFNVKLNKVNLIDNKHGWKNVSTKEAIAGIKDDIFAEDFAAGDFDVVAIDYVAASPDAFATLAVFAKAFSGGQSLKPTDPTPIVAKHISGYDSAEFDAKIEAAYKEKDAAARAALLHEAEKILLTDLPIIPIVYNQNAMLVHEDLSKVTYTYYQTPVFTKTKQKDHERFTEVK